MTVPLRHFVVGLGFLLVGVLVGLLVAVGVDPGLASLAHVHLLLAGWVCITIMGAMTQFVPVWSGVELHSRRLSTVQLWLVAVGLLGFAGGLVAGRLQALPVFGAVMLAGFWVFVYNVGRTLSRVDSYDVTERHFAVALGFFLLVTALGFLLALDLVRPVFAGTPVARPDVVATHATVAVFGAVVTTILGALYQLATMFTQTELHGVDRYLRRGEEVAYPLGVVLLATGRLLGSPLVGAAGGALVAGSLVGFGVILGRRLHETHVEWTPMLSRYAVAAAAMALWGVLGLVRWVDAPLARDSLFGAPGTVHLLGFGVIGFVVVGTLYHVVPFIVWVHRYSDRLGLETVPMIDDLYSGRLAAIEFGLLTGGLLLLVGNDVLAISPVLTATAGGLAGVGAVLFSANMLAVVRGHSPYSLRGVLAARFAPEQADGDEGGERHDGTSMPETRNRSAQR